MNRFINTAGVILSGLAAHVLSFDKNMDIILFDINGVDILREIGDVAKMRYEFLQ